MLKRHQVLLTDWLAEYIWYIAEKYDMSFSEVIRSMLSIQFLRMISSFSSNYKPNLTEKEIVKILKQLSTRKTAEENMHRLLSKLYFETRKAIEFRLEKLGKKQ